MNAVVLVLALTAVRGDGALVAMEGAALRAAEEHRYCDASFIFLQLYGKSRSDLALYRSAETAFAADDRQLALRLYLSLVANHPQADKRAAAEQRIRDLRKLLAEDGPGNACVLPPKACGDWIVAPGEACDDGNLTDGDGCDATCVPTGCGNGTQSIGEACDDGNLADGDGCDSNCTPSACGNGVRAPGEQCDDGNHDDRDTCLADCTLPQPEVRRPSPWPWLVLGGGALALASGGAIAGVGALPFVEHEDARNDIEAAEASIEADPTGALAAARTAQEQQARAARDWSTWGAPLVVAGAVLVSAGLVGAGTGAVLFAVGDE